MAKILIVDDSAFVRASLERILRGESYEVTTASSGAAALEILRKERFDLVITDIYMPAPDGLEVMRQVRTMKLNVPFIAISAKPPPLNMFVPARGLGAHIALQKPFSSEDLIDAVEAVLDRNLASHLP